MESGRYDQGASWLTPELDNLSLSKIKWNKEKDLDINPRCNNNKEHFISADGYYTPCCHVAEHNFYYKSKFYKQKNMYDITKTTLSTLLDQPTTVEFFKTIHEVKPTVCTFSCPKLETNVSV